MKYMHNNWIIGNHQIGESKQNPKNKGNSSKSVIIVKPHYGSSSLDSRMRESGISSNPRDSENRNIR